MQLKLSALQESLRQEVRDFAERTFQPLAQQIDRSGEFPLSHSHAAAKEGLLALRVSESFGGRALDEAAPLLAIEEVSRACSASGLHVMVQNLLVTEPLQRYGSAAVQEHDLRRLASGEIRGCCASSDSNLTVLEQGDGWLLSGEAPSVLGAGLADFATVVTENAAGNAVVFWVELNTEGCERSSHAEPFGVRGSASATLKFDRLALSSAEVLENGTQMAEYLHSAGRIGVAAVALGIAQAAFEAALEHLKTNRSAAKAQANQFYLADMATTIDAARLLTWKAGWSLEHRGRHANEAAQAKLFATQAAQRATDGALQVCGAEGYAAGGNLDRYFRDARALEILHGSREAQKRAIADQIVEL